MKQKSLSRLVSHASATTQRGYYIRTVRSGGSLGAATDLLHCWGMGDELPDAWTEIANDPTIRAAQLFPSTQRNKPHNRRKLIATYKQQATEAVA